MLSKGMLLRTDYLGDGVYARFDGFGVELRVNDHRNPGAVYLEPQVLKALNKFYADGAKALHQAANEKAFLNIPEDKELLVFPNDVNPFHNKPFKAKRIGQHIYEVGSTNPEPVYYFRDFFAYNERYEVSL